MALVCVLYLANDKNLALEQIDDKDFIIKVRVKDFSESRFLTN